MQSVEVVCLSMMLRYCDQVGWHSSKIFSQFISLGCLLFANPNITDLCQREHTKILTGIGVSMQKVAFGIQKL